MTHEPKTEQTNTEVPSDPINRGFEAFAAHPRVPEGVGNIALKVAGVRLAIHRSVEGVSSSLRAQNLRVQERTDRMHAHRKRSAERTWELLEENFGITRR